MYTCEKTGIFLILPDVLNLFFLPMHPTTGWMFYFEYSVDKYYRLGRGIPWFSDEQPSKAIKALVERKLDELNWDIDFVLP